MTNKLIVTILVFLYGLGNASAWDDKLTHREITKVGTENSCLNDYLIDNLAISEGLRKTYNKKTTIELLQDGSENEDIPYRAYNHFWNPIHNEGLDDSGWGWVFENNLLLKRHTWWSFSGLPNLYWAMGETQEGQPLDECGPGDHSSNNDCNDYSWRKARELYFEALVEPSIELRNEYFISFYEKLGRVLHLLQDVAVPAHTRNDMFGHLDFTRFEGVNPLKWGGNLFEYWVKLKLENDNGYISRISSNAIIPDFEKKEDYWDRDEYTGANADITLPIDGKEQVGLSEYSNANFLSKCTIFTEDLPFGDTHYFPSPNKDSIAEMPPVTVIAEDDKIDEVRYLRKYRHGEVIDNFAQARYFCEGLYFTLTDVDLYYRLAFHLDDKVHEAYAEKLIPKTVGFTAGLINYFFRGKIEITPPDRYVYGIIDGSVTPNQFTSIKAKVRNATENEQMGTGQLQAVARYRVWDNYHDDLLGEPPTYSEMKNTEYSYAVSSTIPITSLDAMEPQEYEFDFSLHPIPVGIVDLQFFVIFKGTLGNEADNAVAVGLKDISEPMHIIVVNSTDRIYLCNAPVPAPYTVDQIENNGVLLNIVDLDNDGHYCGETDEDGLYYVCYGDEPFVPPVDEDIKLEFYSHRGFPGYQVTYTHLNAERYGRVILLTEDETFMIRADDTPIHPAVIPITDRSIVNINATSNHPNEVTIGGAVYSYVRTPAASYRGIYSHHYFGRTTDFPENCCPEEIIRNAYPLLEDSQPVEAQIWDPPIN